MPEGDVISQSDEELLKELKTGQTFYLKVFIENFFMIFQHLFVFNSKKMGKSFLQFKNAYCSCYFFYLYIFYL